MRKNAFMRCVVQRVREASVEVDGHTTGAIGPGLVVLLGVAPDDTEAEAQWLVEKVARLRIFSDDAGKFNQSLLDVQGSVLVVSQFTLFADVRKGTRPSFTGAAVPTHAEPMYERWCDLMAEHGVTVARGVFGANMQVHLINDGPVTITLERTAAHQ
jgi:D-tyrosyl-tRNA(Tyr) deacylase